ncbi:MAG TPA: outer membrane lipoprotein carrier protein LolA [Bryobacteraceae bacterium]
MKIQPRAFAAFLLTVTVAVPAADPLHDLLARMDRAASTFQAMSGKVTYVTHTDVLNDDSIESGTVVMKKVAPGEVQGLIDFLKPDRRTVAFEKRSLQIFYPKINTVNKWDLGKHGEQLDQFIMIGFGTSGTQLARDYSVKVLPNEKGAAPQDVPTIRLELIPKAGEAREYLKKLELWIPQTGDPYPVREKISQSSGDYRLVIYSDLKINPPLRPDALQLKLPPGVKFEQPGK